MTALPRSESADDADLVRAALRGDAGATGALYDRHRAPVAATCRRWAATATDAEDAVQEAFVRAFAQLDQLREPGCFGAWVRSTARRVCLDQHAGSRRDVTVADVVVVDPDRPEDPVLAREEADALHRHLAALTPRDREALWLRDAEGRPVPEVAAYLGLTVGSTRVLLTRARHRLRSRYAAVAAAAVGLVGRLRGRSAGPGAVASGAAVVPALVAALVVVPWHGVAPVPDEAPPVRPSEAVTEPPDGGPSADRATATPAASAGATAGAPATSSTPPGSPPAAPPREPASGPVRIGDEPPQAEPAAQVTAETGDGPVAEAMVYLGDVAAGSRDGTDEADDGDGDPNGEDAGPSDDERGPLGLPVIVGPRDGDG